ncbi:cytochrome c maturation protein CcmE [Sporomusa acidovorans]|uniref:Cytochrome c-type biogenesis protein CcmE n=1 Tax=Sporomusa acidovorans (strain ATCC 49682 / DSM 3132 / Mol) TaxID=1123286 RepID=A0ABZ3J003_SPOA4|nr:cytochrome c maturation protein CcmE [Sporomusa acidovorans]OZC21340.1 cytochrome c-type biogenesis protein CcmE [Sporomusa acidovorans DSM 3132]SDE56867.1 cytochrome c-type biogenesis protein CcmE [Sporomusa acidovorans]
MKKGRLLCLVIIAGFIGYSIFMYQSSLTPYVTFAQAKSAKSAVQVKGTLATPQVTPTEDGSGIAFVLRDEAGEEVTVTYHGAKPDGMEKATGIVAIGKYNNGRFLADKVLVKCPSKYQGSVNNK